MSSEQQPRQITRSDRSSTTSSVGSGYSRSAWLELTQATTHDDASSVTSGSTTFLPLTVAVSSPKPQRNISDEERRLFLLRARNN